METNVIYWGSWLDVAERIPDKSVQLVVTSPPYYQMRKYGSAGEDVTIWGGDPNCAHVWGELLPGDSKGGGGAASGYHMYGEGYARDAPRGQFCQKCGAWRGALGREPTPALYIAHLVECFHPLLRILRDDGSLWVNIDDARVGSRCGMGDRRERTGLGAQPSKLYKGQYPGTPAGMWPTELMGIPHMFVAAMRADGWLWRDEIVWYKTAAKPESVIDRCTHAFEYVFVFTKPTRTPRFWVHPHRDGTRHRPKPDYTWEHRESGEITTSPPPDEERKQWIRRNRWQGYRYFFAIDTIREPYTQPMHRWGGVMLKAGDRTAPWDENVGQQLFRDRSMRPDPRGRHPRDVWPIKTQGFKGAHFAVFPRELVRRIILVASSPRACPHCGAPWMEVYEQQGYLEDGKTRNMVSAGWHPTCDCEDNDGSASSIVLDIFSGAGTTLVEADSLGRRYIGCDIIKEYAYMSAQRILADRDEREVNDPDTAPHVVAVSKTECKTIDTPEPEPEPEVAPESEPMEAVEFHLEDMSTGQLVKDYLAHRKDVHKHPDDDEFVVVHVAAQSFIEDELRRRGGNDAVVALRTYALATERAAFFKPEMRQRLLAQINTLCAGGMEDEPQGNTV